VLDIAPPVAANPWTWVARLNSPQVAHTYAPGSRIDPGAFHQAQVDHHAVVTHRSPGHVVTTTAYGDFKILRDGKFDGIDHIGNTDAAHDDRGITIDHAIVNSAHSIECVIVGRNHLTGNPLTKILESCRVELIHSLIHCACVPPGERRIHAHKYELQ
jgi:hypothetical protein